MRPNCILSPVLFVLFCMWESQWIRTEGSVWTGYRNQLEKSCPRNVSKTRLVTIVPVEDLVMGREEFGIRDKAEVTKMPCWFDPMLARIGQKFARQSITQLMIAHFMSLFLLVSNPEIRRVLYFTMKSDNPTKAWKRYTATILQVKLWYDDDLLVSKNFLQSLQRVKNVHRSMGSQLAKAQQDFNRPLLTQKQAKEIDLVPSTKLWNAIRKDLELSRHVVSSQINMTIPSPLPKSKYKYNQYVMAMTQFSFMALPLLFPKQLSLTQVSDVELQGFVHLWAGISYALGMNESYILCKDLDLNSCREYTRAMLNKHFVPYLYQIDYEAQVMLESLVRAVKLMVPPVTTEFMILWLLEDILGIPCPNVRNISGAYTRISRFMGSVFLQPLLRVPFFQWLANIILRGEIQLSTLKHFGFDGTNSTVVADKGFYFGK